MSDPLQQAVQLQIAAAAEGFDWPQDSTLNQQLWAKLYEEIAELQQAPDLAARAEELGDLLFMVVNLGRHLHIDPSAALSAANRKFERRFGYILERAAALPPLGEPGRLDAMESLWLAAKQAEKRGELE
ncbi:MAG: MazG family protein [Nevskia sp.]|nr:MazG family protein [Nevskia sp.]